jgi:ABC-type transport system involved in multi-copper enzyme maturation permease subunit
MTVLLVLFLLSALFLAGMPLLARLGWQPFGPLYQHELLRLSRRNSLTLWRAGLVGTQLLMMLLNYIFSFPGIPVQDLLFGTNDFIDPTASQQFAEAFLWKFLWVQQIAAIVLTPIYLGGAIAEEKERKAWDFLLTSSLSSWELITGKFTARLTYVLSILAAGLPVLLLTLLFGGVNPERVLQGFLVSGSSVVGLGMVSLWVGVHRPRLRDVLLWVFLGLVGTLLLALIGFCFTPVTLCLHPASVLYVLEESDTDLRFDSWGVTTGYCTLMLTIGGLFLLLSFVQVRKSSASGATNVVEERAPWRPPVPTPMRVSEVEMPEWYQLKIRDVALGDRSEYALGRRKFVPPITDADDPLDWKERHFASQVSWLEAKWLRSTMLLVMSFVAFLVCAGWFISIAIVLATGSTNDPYRFTTLRTMGGVTAFVVVCILPYLGLRTSMSVAEERASQTLQELLMLPSDRSAILWAKVRAPFQVMTVPLICLFLGVMIACITSLDSIVICLLYVAYMAMFCAWNVSFGLYLSVLIRSSLKAALVYLGAMVFLYMAPPLLFGFYSAPGAITSSPFAAAFEFVGRIDSQKAGNQLYERFLALYSLIYLGLAVFFGWAAKIRFDKEAQT